MGPRLSASNFANPVDAAANQCSLGGDGKPWRGWNAEPQGPGAAFAVRLKSPIHRRANRRIDHKMSIQLCPSMEGQRDFLRIARYAKNKPAIKCSDICVMD
jgi:hypothetical protein